MGASVAEASAQPLNDQALSDQARPTGPRPWVVSLLRPRESESPGRRITLIPALPPMPRRGVLLVGVVAGLLALFGGAVLSLSTLVSRKPAWWKETPIGSNAVAEQIESGMLGHLTAVRAGDPTFVPTREISWRSEVWKISLKEEDANTWLALKLPEYLANRQPSVRWPREIEGVRVWFDKGEVRLGAKVRQGGEVRYVGTTLRPKIREDGSMWMPSDGVNVGALSAPAWSIGAARSIYGDPVPANIAAMPEVKSMFGAFQDKNPVLKDAIVRLEGGRRVRILSITPRNGWIEIMCWTEKRS